MMRKTILICLIYLGFILHAPTVAANDDYAFTELSLIVYSDGAINVNFWLDLNPTLARINVSAIGFQARNLVVKDQEGILLESVSSDGYIQVDVLGSQSINIQYTTIDITSKDRRIWGLKASLPIETNIRLPESATIISLEPIPLGISVIGESTTLTMPSGNITIDYVIGIVGTKEHSLAVINDAEEIIFTLTSNGVIVTDAEALIELATNAHEAENYVQAEEYATQVKSSALETGALEENAKTALDEAAIAIQDAKDEGRTTSISVAETKLEEALTAYSQGDYARSATIAEVATIEAFQSRRPALIDMRIILVSAAILALVGIFAHRKFIKKGETAVPVVAVDLDLIFSNHPLLRMDEKEVIRHISEAEGGIFLSELRERFDLPRSSTWRMIRRLEGEEILKTKKVGRETFIELNEKYLKT